MDNVFRYWQLVRLTSAGQLQTLENAAVQTWLEATFAELLVDSEGREAKLQKALLAGFRGGKDNADLALLSLRCWITHQIRNLCVSLARRYGDRHGFAAGDLFPLVLDDDGQLSPTYRPFTLEILETFDPTKANLGTWSGRLTKTHPALNRMLLEKGIYQASDWAILNDTTLEQVQRILREYHLCSDYEVREAARLLENYHGVYRRDRILQRQTGQTGRCLEPTPEQLQQINPALNAKVVKAQLKQLASQLRQYRIHVRSGNPQIYQVQDDSELERIAGSQADPSLGEDDDPTAFLHRYREALTQCLGQTIAQVIEANVAKLRHRHPPQDWAYVQGLYLRQCEGLPMGKLADQIGLSSQVQVTRLLNLKRLRSEVRHQLIPQLYSTVRQAALSFVSADRLQALDATLEALLTEEVDSLMADAAAEAQAPKRRAVKSRFTDQLCTEIHAFMSGQEK